MQARASEHNTPTHPSCARPCHQKHYSRRIWHQITCAEEAQRCTCRPGALCAGASFAKLRPLGHAQSALPRHHCLMHQCHAFTQIWPSQERPIYLCHMVLGTDKAECKASACGDTLFLQCHVLLRFKVLAHQILTTSAFAKSPHHFPHLQVGLPSPSSAQA